MESPLEEIVSKHLTVYKPYKPEPPKNNNQEQAIV
jgi:hypothetical protein